MSDTTGWTAKEEGYATVWSKSIMSGSSGFPFRIIRINTRDLVHIYSLGMHEYPHWFAERISLEEAQILAHATARLWAGDTE